MIVGALGMGSMFLVVLEGEEDGRGVNPAISTIAGIVSMW